MGCLHYETGHVYVEEHKRYDAEVFLQFLKNVLSLYPEGKIVMFLDNAGIHHAKLLKGFLDENKKRLELVFLPPYIPELSKIEEIQVAMQKFIDWISTVPQMVIDRLCLLSDNQSRYI